MYIRPSSGQTGAKWRLRWNVAKSETRVQIYFHQAATDTDRAPQRYSRPLLCNVMAVTMQLITITQMNNSLKIEGQMYICTWINYFAFKCTFKYLKSSLGKYKSILK